MIIAFVSDAIYPYHKGGKEKRLYEISTRLAKMGHEIHIYTMHWWQSSENSITEDGLHLHAISKFYPLYKGNRRSIKEGVLFGLACLKLGKVQFDVMDVDHMPFFPIFSTWLICKLRGKRLYGTWHEALTRKDWINYMGNGGYIASVIEDISIKLPYFISATSLHTQMLIKSVHGRSKRVDTVTPGIDTKLINAVVPVDIICDVLYVGRLVKDKNVNKLIEAVGIIAITHPDIQCIILGSGIEKTRLIDLIKRLKLSQNIQMLDSLESSTDVYSYMKAAKVFCIPSVREGFGMSALESLGCGTPVVTVDSPSNAAKDLIQDGINGSVVQTDSKELASAISYWLVNGNNRITGLEVSQYDWDTVASKQFKVYEQ